MGPGRGVYIVPYGSCTTLGRPKGLKQIVLSSFVVFDLVKYRKIPQISPSVYKPLQK